MKAQQPAPPQRPPSWRELGLLYLATLLITGAFSLAPFGGWLGDLLYFGVALSFIALPTLAVQRWRRGDPIAAGMDYGKLKPALRWSSLATLATLIPFLIGFHLWTTQVNHKRLSLAWSNYLQWPAETRQLDPAPEPKGLSLWTEGDRLHLKWQPPEQGPRGALMIEVSSERPLLLKGRSAGIQLEQGERHWAIHSPASHAFELGLMQERPKGELRVDWQAEHGTIPAFDAQGQALEPAFVLLPSWTWVLSLLLTQLLLVGLPEEFFYRGYLQPSIAKLTRRRWRLGPIELSAAILITSMLFALGHFAIDPRPARLAVFFPSLAFGWLRERSGGLTAPIIYHAACNTMVELALVHYTLA